MLNDVKTPPPMPRDDGQPTAGVNGRGHVAPSAAIPGPVHAAPKSTPNGSLHNTPAIHTDPQEPGVHHARIFGEKTHLDPEYAMPMEERGSFFNVGLTVIAGLIAVAVLFVVFWAIR